MELTQASLVAASHRPVLNPGRHREPVLGALTGCRPVLLDHGSRTSRRTPMPGPLPTGAAGAPVPACLSAHPESPQQAVNPL